MINHSLNYYPIVHFLKIKVEKFLRKSSLDELPQIWNIFIGEMSIIGLRPALWNQYDLIAERDKYDANDFRPGLTGLAQISGRNELVIEVKAKLEGEYVNYICFTMDVKYFFGTIVSVFGHEGIVEGGTGVIQNKVDILVDEIQALDKKII